MPDWSPHDGCAAEEDGAADDLTDVLYVSRPQPEMCRSSHSLGHIHFFNKPLLGGEKNLENSLNDDCYIQRKLMMKQRLGHSIL